MRGTMPRLRQARRQWSQSYPLSACSAGPNDILVDQRGEPRPAPGETDPDIGAFELQQSHGTAVGAEDGEHLEGDRQGQALLGLGGDDRLFGKRSTKPLSGCGSASV
jgi:hypothetical protein